MKNSTKRSIFFAAVIALTVCAFVPSLPQLDRTNAVQQIANGPVPYPPPGGGNTVAVGA
jgi:hypothetical protein